tara:strand:+ start:1148 stop:1597 length:450 start_codon:yes stop_codon:yes gene_type:complete
MTIEEATTLVERVCRNLDLNIDELKSKLRTSKITQHRRVFMHLLSNVGMTVKSIGSVFNKHHATVIYSNKKHKDFMEIRDKDYIKIYKTVKREFIFKIHTVDNTMQNLLDIITAENAIRYDELLYEVKKNRKLTGEIKYLKGQINILNK